MTAVLDEPELDDPLYADLDVRTLDPIAPAYVWRPPRVRSMAPQLEQLAAALGRPLDPEQYDVVDVLTGERADGRPAARTGVVVSGRQNVKTWALELYAIARAVRPQPTRRIVWSAHEVATSSATMQDVVELIDTHRWLRAHVVQVKEANGKESIRWRNGCEWVFRARIRTGGRGLFGDVVVLDEGFALLTEHMGSLIPIMSTRPYALALVGSSAGMVTSDVLRDLRDRGRRGGIGAPAYVEYCAPGSFADPPCTLATDCPHEVGTPGCVMDSLAHVVQANLAVRSGRIGLDHLREERRTLDPLEFGRERLGWWEDAAATGRGFAVEAWLALTDRGSKPKKLPVGYAVDTTAGLRSAVVVRVGERADGRRHVEVAKTGQGVAWVAPWLKGRTKRVRVLGGSSTAQALVPLLEQERIEVVETPVADYAAGCSLLAADVRDQALRHLGDAILERAIRAAGTVAVGDDGAWRWSQSRSTGDVTALTAATLARLEVETSPRRREYTDEELMGSSG